MANYQSRYTGPEIDERLRKAGEAVLTEAQSLDAGKQAQARENIGAASSAAVDGKYTKPSGGIPKADLASGVQASLGKADTAYQKPASGIPASDIAENVIPDVSQFITKTVNDLANYYLKTDTYTKDEVQQLISTIHGFSYEVVATLPAASADTMGKIYLAPSADPQSQNIKDEYITIDNGASAQTRYTWEQIGSTAVDLSDYVTTSDLNTALAAYTTSADLTTLLAAKQDTISDLADIRSGAAAGATAYQKPHGGIPATDLADKYAGSPSAGGPAFKALGIPYGAVDSDSTATNIKATVDNFPETLVAGVCAYIRNDIIASASGFTLNINGTGALPVYQSLADASRVTTLFSAASTFLFVYNPTRVEGGCWDLYYGYNSNDNTVGYNLRTNGGTAVAAAKFYRYRLLFTAPDGQSLVPSNTSSSTSSTAAKTVNQAKIDPFAPIWYYSTTTAINAGSSASASYLWMQYSAIPLGYAFNRTGAALTMTARYPVYLKCAPQSDGSAIMDADTPIVQALPSTEDGKIYIFLGYAESEVNITLYYWHPVYYFKDGAIRQWTNAAAASITVDQTYDGTSTNAQSGVAMAGALATKQDVIQDLSTIRSGASAGATAYQKPGTGIPASDLASGVIPSVPTISTDISADATSDAKTASPKAVKTYVDGVASAINEDIQDINGDIADLGISIETIGNGAFVVAWDGESTPVAADIPAGVSVTYDGDTYTGSLAASASTLGKIYLVATGTSGNYDRYVTVGSSTYSWTHIGTTSVALEEYATNSKVSQLEAKVNRLFLDIGLADVNFDIHYTVTNNLSNCTTDNDDTTASLGESYEATITPDDGYDLSSVAVLMGNEDITEDVYDGEGGISIPTVEGDITITAIAVEHGVTVVTFADPIVEQIAYAQGWDDNGIFTTDSLAAVTRIDAVFKGAGITTFDEFQYFTGILAAYNQLAQDAFRGCTALTSIVIPENCPIYGNSIFQGCSSLTSIVVPDGVTKISGSFFRDCTSLVTIDLGKDIATIGNLWAQSDAAVTTLICRATTPPTADWSLFTGMSNLAHIYVPAASVDAYKAATNWSAKASIIEAIPE